MVPRMRSTAILLISLAFVAVAFSENTNSEPTAPSIEDSRVHSALPSLQDCARWAKISTDNAAEGALHEQMCNPLGRIKPEVAEPPAEEDTKAVQAIAEAVLEVLPSSQQNFALIRDGEQSSSCLFIFATELVQISNCILS